MLGKLRGACCLRPPRAKGTINLLRRLLYKSRYIPRVISGLYLFSAIEMLLCCFAFITFPRTRAVLDPAFLVPDFFAELSAALWLAIKGATLPAPAEVTTPSLLA